MDAGVAAGWAAFGWHDLHAGHSHRRPLAGHTHRVGHADHSHGTGHADHSHGTGHARRTEACRAKVDNSRRDAMARSLLRWLPGAGPLRRAIAHDPHVARAVPRD